MVTDANALLVQLARAFEAADIRYVVGGSIASSRHGEYRATNDIDVLAEVGPASIAALVAALGDDFHLDREAADLAVRSGGTFTAIHLKEFVKIDFFVATEAKLHRLQLERRESVAIDASAPPVYITSAEDTILVKLEWFRRSGGVLERQLRDVAGVLKVRGRELDLEYLGHAATLLGLRDLLARALEDAGLDATG